MQGLPYTKQYLNDPLNWVNYEIREIVGQRAAELTQDEAILYQVALSSPGLQSFGGLEHLIKLLGNPQIAYHHVSKYSGFFDRTLKFQTTPVSANQVIISMSLPAGYQRSKSSCYFTQGMLAVVPTLWGLPPAEVRESRCMCTDSPDSGTTSEEQACVYEVTWQSLPPVRRRLLDKLSRKNSSNLTNIKKLEDNFALLDRKNAELTGKNRQLAKVRELALAIDGIKSREQVYRTVVEMARDIPNVHFVIMLKADETGKYITAPYYSKIRGKTLTTALKAIGFDLNNYLGENPNSEKFKFKAADSNLTLEYENNPKVTVRSSFSQVMEGIWPKALCDTIQRVAGIKSITIAPIIVDGESWGSILFFLNNEVDQDILEMVGAHCASAIKNATVLEKLEKRNTDLAALNRIANSIARSLDVTSLLSGALKDIVEIYKADAAAIYLWDAAGQHLRLAGQQGMPEEMTKNHHNSFRQDTSFYEFFLSQQEMISGKLSDYSAEFPEYENLTINTQPQHYLTSIIKLRSKRSGIITLVRKGARPFSLEEKWLLSSVAGQLAVGIENSTLHSDALKRMTEAENARAELQQALDRQIRMETELKQSEEKYKTIFESANDIILLLDNKGKIVDVNNKLKDIGGYDRDILLGQDIRSLTKILTAKSIALVAMNFLKRTAGFKVPPYEVEMVKSDGSKAVIEINAVAVRKEGKIVGDLAILRDITARKQAQVSLQESEQRFKALYEQEKKEHAELEEEAKARAQFINVLAHELRTPLTPIMVSVEMLGDLLSAPPDSVQFKLLHNTMSSAESLKDRLEELLDLARFTRGAFQLKPQTIETSEFLRLIAERYQPALTQKHQQLVIQIPADLPQVEADPSRLEQVVLNLLSNAGKYSPVNSVITYKALIKDYKIQIEVKDQGIGIEPEDQKSLFLPYHRAEQDRQSYPGIGLGLAVAKQIIEAHEGKIWVESQRGHGCTFKFNLPVNTETISLDSRNSKSTTKTKESFTGKIN